MISPFPFLEALAENNNREWFQAHRPEYEELRAQFILQVQRVLDRMALTSDPTLAHVDARDCLYRINRNLRFSRDKTPYKTYFAALLSPMGRHYDKACYYIHMGFSSINGVEAGLYGGLWEPESAVLKKVRKAIIDNIEEFDEIITNPALVREFPGWTGRKLKTVPQGWPKDHPRRELLRLQEYGKFKPLGREFFESDSWPERAADLLGLLEPLNAFLNYSIDE